MFHYCKNTDEGHQLQWMKDWRRYVAMWHWTTVYFDKKESVNKLHSDEQSQHDALQNTAITTAEYCDKKSHQSSKFILPCSLVQKQS